MAADCHLRRRTRAHILALLPLASTQEKNSVMAEAFPIVITGASSGIGKAAALRFARTNRPLVMICREGPKARAAHAEIIRLTGNQAVELETADLASQAQIRAVAQAIRDKHAGIAALVNNAGISSPERRLSPDGIELTFAVNHLAPFLLTNLLLDRLRAGAPARVITVSSDLQRPLRLDDLARNKRYSPTEVYGETKLANILFTFELARRLAGSRVTANALAPGFLRTAITRHASRGKRALFSVLGVFVMESADKGGARIAHLALAPELASTSGEFFVKSQPAKASAPAYDEALAAQLWAMSERLTGLTPAPVIDAAAE
ncbi:MAG TPA: SDR family NAD(P)-dependent oxidoreductase [Devosiaceae bacterium]|nr:SDR family NAD(P)-dependent oxidoreductase [Devosiaceae bacterium]